MRFRKTKISIEEIVDDIIYFLLSAFLGLLVVFIFDIHHSFYKPPYYPFKFIFNSYEPYLIRFFGAGVLGLIWIKVFLFALERGTYRKIKKFVKR
ncbi:MAG: hypothetical protein B6U78_00905 [Candidatus Aenigmarchaeota archaeon ex4484_224]|nr:MAG: hypothetical protein B6U78_00905 [Candidatus Aenigmarchaeota archaeon ex4484_224]